MPMTDRAFRALALEQPEIIGALLELCAPDLLPPGTKIDVGDVDAPSLVAPPSLEADWVARVGDSVVLHVEAQGYRDDSFVDRLFRYHLGFVLRYPDRQVRSVALWLRRPPRSQRAQRIDRQGVAIQVTPLVLGEVSAALLLSRPETACLAAGADPGEWSVPELCGRVVAAMGQQATERERMLAAALAMSTGRLDAIMEAMKRAEMELPIIEDFVHYGEDRGHKRGLAEGLATGAARGETRGKATAVLSVLRARGLTVDPAEEQRIAGCEDAVQLDEWLRRAATANVVGDVLG